MHFIVPTLTSHTTISMTVGWMWKLTPQVDNLSPHALTKRIQAVSCLLIDNYPLSLWMTAEHLNIGKNTVYMIAKQNLGWERQQMMKIKKKITSKCFYRSWCFMYHPDDTPWRVGKILPKLKKMCLQKSWKKTLSVLLTQFRPLRIPSRGPNH